MRAKNKKVLDIIVVGSGIAGLNFIDKYLEKGKKINVISPKKNSLLKANCSNNIKILPTQMRGKHSEVDNYFAANDLETQFNCKAIGSLSFGGLSNYWGLQIDNYINNDQKNLKKKNFNSIRNFFLEFVKKYNLLGSISINNKKVFDNDFFIPKELSNLESEKNNKLECRKPILAFTSTKNFNGDLNNIKEKHQKLTAENVYKKINKKNNIIFHNYYLQKIKKKKNLIELTCKNNNKEKKFLVRKLIFATGTIVTTKILMDFLNIKNEVRIKHHPRLLSVFFSKKIFKYNLNFTPALLQIINKSKKDYFSADLRPGNKLITDSIIDAFPLMRPLKFLINLTRKRLIFSNILLDSGYSNLYLNKKNGKFRLYSKEKNLKSILRSKNKKIFKFLFNKGLILPIYRTFFPGNGADYHYFGTIPFKNNGKLAVNNNCQLISSKNIYIIDGSIFDFKTNKYPFGIIAANARRIGKHLSR